MSKSAVRIVPEVSALGVAALICVSIVAMPRAEAADAAAGQQVFRQCAVCHSTTAGENKVGPSLAGVFGRKSGSEPGFAYSPALKSAGITWDEQALDKFLANPASDVHGTKMTVGVPKAEDRENLIAYLKTLK